MHLYILTREMRCLRHKIHMGLFCAFGLSALNWILTLSWRNLVRQDLAEPLLCTTFTLTYFFHLTSFYWMFLEGNFLSTRWYQ
jgi:corticotropin releasing hormone receptor 1